MPHIVHGFNWPDRFVVGTVGEPGSRTFYLQARSGSEMVSVALEKEQSAALAQSIDKLLDELMAGEDNPFSIPAQMPEGLIDNDGLDHPVAEEFRVGTMSLGWDPSTAQIVIEAVPIQEGDSAEPKPEPAEPDPEEVLVVRIPVGAARAFAKRTREVVGAGRPFCPLCRLPMDPEGHVCDLTDGFA